MAKTIEQLKAQGAQVKNATVVGENTATRVGTLFTDIVEYMEQVSADGAVTTSKIANGAVTTEKLADNAMSQAMTTAITDEAQARAKADEELNTAIGENKSKLQKLNAVLDNKKSAVKGKNLFNKNNVTKGFFLAGNSINQNASLCISEFIEVEPNTQYCISNTGTGGAENVEYDENAEYIGKVAKNGVFTTSSNTRYVRLSVAIAKLNVAQFEKGSKATTYEEYTDDYANEQAITELQNNTLANTTAIGENKSKLQKLNAVLDNKKSAVKGKNLFNKNNVTKGFFLAGNSINQNASLCISEFIEVEPNTQYCISNTGTGGAENVEYDENAEYIGKVAKNGVFTTSSNTRYVRLSVAIAKLNVAQFEKGSKATTYEEYTDDYANEQAIISLREDISVLREDINEKVPSSSPKKNLFNKNSIVAAFLSANGGVYGNQKFVTSKFIPVRGGETITAYPLATGPIYFCQYNSAKEFIQSTTNKQTLTVTLNQDCAFIRATFPVSNYETEAQIEYGSVATKYEPYQLVIDNNWLPENMTNAVDCEGVINIIDEQLFADKKIVLPSTIYIKVDNEKRNNIYIKQAVKCSSLRDINIDIASVPLGLYMFNRQLSGITTTEASADCRITARSFDRQLDRKTIKFVSVGKPDSVKSVRILDTGDSISDLGGYQVALKKTLEENNVSVEYIGTMINKVNIGSYQSPEYVENIWGEVQSGGNMGFLTEANGAAKILNVSGITELPQTGYPGTSYTDENGNSWVVRGFRLTQGEDGKYAGKLKIGKFKSDPNYGDGTTDDTSSSKGFPPSGMITKSNSYNGDDVIMYSSFDDARYNPFWNPQTDELDFQYYFNYWGFGIPDIFIMQWGYNEVNNYDNIDSANVLQAVSRAKQIIDKFHSQCPGAIVLFGLEIYGREGIKYAGGLSNSADSKKFAVLSMAEKFIETFETYAYKDYVMLVPLYALMDHINGYGSYTEIQLCDLYTYGKETVAINGTDGVHPSYKYGLTEIGRAYAPYILNIVKG